MARTWTRVVWALVLAFAALIVVEIFAGLRAAGEPRAAQVPGVWLRLVEFLAGSGREWEGYAAFDACAGEWVGFEISGSLSLELDLFRFADLDGTVRIALYRILSAGGVRVVTGAESVEWQRTT